MVGIDIVKISRVKLTDSFIKRVLTIEEQTLLQSFQSEKRQKEFLAGRFASKEAIFKLTQDSNYLSYAILKEPSGKPYIKDHPELSISISHDGDNAIVIVIRNGENICGQ